VNVAASVEEGLGNLGALAGAFHVEDEEPGSLAAFEPEIGRLRFELLGEGADRLLQGPDLSAALPWVASR
jgi:hypothetical protein